MTALVAVLAAPLQLDAQQLRWEPFGAPLEGGSVTAFAVDAEGRTYAGTYSGRVFRSTDGSEHWLAPDSSRGSREINRLHAYPTGGHVLAETYEMVSRSTDGGRTWDSTAPVGIVALHHQSGSAYLITATGVLHSTDRGGQWVKVADSIPLSQSTSAIVHEGTGSIVVGGRRDVVRSEDHGRTWTRVADSLGRSSSTVIQQMLAAPGGSLFATGYRLGIVRSTDAGRTWADASEGLDSTVNSWTIAVAPDGRLVAAEDSGRIYASTDDGAHWIATGGRLGADPSALVAVGNGQILAGFHDYGIEKSLDDGQTFTASIDGFTDIGDAPAIGVDANGRVYASTRKLIYRVDDREGTWQRLSVPKTTWPVRPLAIAGGGWIVSGVVQSHDHGLTWRVEEDGLFSFGRTLLDCEVDPVTDKVFVTSVSGVYAMESTSTEWGWPQLGGIALTSITAHPSGALFCGGMDFLMYRSTDGGNLWAESDDGLPTSSGRRTLDIAVDRRGNVFAATSEGVYRSTDTGATWHRLGVGTHTTEPFMRLLSNPDGPIVAVAGEPGVAEWTMFLSTDAGATWIEQLDRPPGVIESLALDSTGRIYAGVSGGRVYRTVESTSSVPLAHRRADRAVDLDVTPNPTRGTMRAAFALAERSRVSISVIDLLGRRVAGTDEMELDEGPHRLGLELGGVASGVYVLRLTIDGTVAASRTFVVR